jgi:hypothetical protein
VDLVVVAGDPSAAIADIRRVETASATIPRS